MQQCPLLSPTPRQLSYAEMPTPQSWHSACLIAQKRAPPASLDRQGPRTQILPRRQPRHNHPTLNQHSANASVAHVTRGMGNRTSTAALPAATAANANGTKANRSTASEQTRIQTMTLPHQTHHDHLSHQGPRKRLQQPLSRQRHPRRNRW